MPSPRSRWPTWATSSPRPGLPWTGTRWPRCHPSRHPRNIQALHGFLGLAGYYRQFIRNFGVLAAPLTTLLRKEGFVWSDEATTTFDALKQALLTAPVLHLPDFLKAFIVDCDASGMGFGGVLH